MERWRVRRDWLRFSRALHVTPQADLALVGTTQEAYFLPETLPQPEWICYCAGVGRRSASSSSSRTGSGARYTCIRPDTSVDRLRHTDRAGARLPLSPRRTVVRGYGADLLGTAGSSARVVLHPEHQAHRHALHSRLPSPQLGDARARPRPHRSPQAQHRRGRVRVFDSLAEDELFPRLILVHMHVLDSVSDALSAARALEARGYVAIHEYRMSVTWLHSEPAPAPGDGR